MKATIVIPSFNERDSVAPLLQRIEAAVGHLDVSVLYVDDSTDGTERVVAEMAKSVAFPLAVIHRETRRGGLSGAVVEGIRAAAGDVVVVCDGDGQHPPDVIPAMLERLASDPHVDAVVASRYRTGGDAAGLSNGTRRFVSTAATRLAKLLFRRRLRRCSDPMTGFFAMRTRAIDVSRLNPLGFKILLEILATHELEVAEVPFRFGARAFGESKATTRQGIAYLRQLADLRRRRHESA